MLSNQVIVALMALVSSLVGWIVGIWQWRNQPRKAKQEKFSSERLDIYKKFWELLEQAHLEMRQTIIINERFHESNNIFSVEMLT